MIKWIKYYFQVGRTELTFSDRNSYTTWNMSTKRLSLIIAAFMVFSLFVIILSGFPATKGDFYLDSHAYFRLLPYFQEQSLDWEKVQDIVINNPYTNAKRPLANLTFILENNLVGLTPGSGRYVNMVIHWINMVLVFFIIRRILTLLGKSPVHAMKAAAAASALWGLNPFFSDTVYYVIQRMTLLAATFYLSAILFYLRARSSSGRKQWLWWLGVGLSFLLGCLSKENVILLPLGIVVIEYILGSFGGNLGNLARNKRVFLALVAFTVAIPLVIMLLGYDIREIGGSLFAAEGRVFTTGERILTQGRVLSHYLSLIFFPSPERLSGSSAEFVGRLRFREFPKCMI